MRILLKVFPQRSHLNATFPLARALVTEGHDVVYAGIEELRAHVEAQGLPYVIHSDNLFPFVEETGRAQKLSLVSYFRNLRTFRRGAKACRFRMLNEDLFAGLVRDFRPDLVLVDSPYTLAALSLFRTAVPFAIMESMVNLYRRKGAPPLDTAFVPDNSTCSNFICRLHWRRYFVKRWILGKLGFRLDYCRSFARQLARRNGVSEKAVSYDRYFHPGIPEIAEIILSPWWLDFRAEKQANQLYYNPRERPTRSEGSFDYRFNQEFARLIERRASGAPIVYCSLGTAWWRYDSAEAFLRRMVMAARGQKWNLILTTGGAGRGGVRLGPLGENVFVFYTVPQLRVLGHADLMVTHGGMNSIAECAQAGVPALVYPGAADLDQPGNAARAAYHGWAMVGDMRRASVEDIRTRINTMLLRRKSLSVSTLPQIAPVFAANAREIGNLLQHVVQCAEAAAVRLTCATDRQGVRAQSGQKRRPHKDSPAAAVARPNFP